jgi:hypothetical protein
MTSPVAAPPCRTPHTLSTPPPPLCTIRAQCIPVLHHWGGERRHHRHGTSNSSDVGSRHCLIQSLLSQAQLRGFRHPSCESLVIKLWWRHRGPSVFAPPTTGYIAQDTLERDAPSAQTMGSERVARGDANLRVLVGTHRVQRPPLRQRHRRRAPHRSQIGRLRKKMSRWVTTGAHFSTLSSLVLKQTSRVRARARDHVVPRASQCVPHRCPSTPQSLKLRHRVWRGAGGGDASRYTRRVRAGAVWTAGTDPRGLNVRALSVVLG